MRWRISDRFDPVARAIADRHYSRLKRGKPGTPQFVSPGRCLVLLTDDSTAERGCLWVTTFPQYRRDAWAGAWLCEYFRNEMPDRHLSSELIGEALAASAARFGPPPDKGMATFIDEDEVRPKRNPGYCFLVAGFEVYGRTQEFGRLVLWLPPDRCPAPIPANHTQERMIA